MVGVRGAVSTFLSGGTTTNAYALQGIIDTSYAATISNAVGLQIDSAVKHASGTITDNYGIRVENQTAGASDYGLYVEGADTYALWVDSGASRLDGTLTVAEHAAVGAGAQFRLCLWRCIKAYRN